MGAGGAPGKAARARAQRVDVLPQACVLDGERFKAREQREVHLVLPPEVLARVLVEPAVQRQQHASLEEQERAANHGTVGREAQRRVDAPVFLVGQQLGQQQLAAIARVEPAPEHAGDGVEDLRIPELRRSARREPLPHLRADASLQIGHDGGDIDARRSRDVDGRRDLRRHSTASAGRRRGAGRRG